jgi:hypothetical protein
MTNFPLGGDAMASGAKEISLIHFCHKGNGGIHQRNHKNYHIFDIVTTYIRLVWGGGGDPAGE